MHDSFADLFLVAANDPDQRQPGSQAVMIFVAIAVFFFYIIVIRPATRDRKKLDNMLTNLKKNDRVLTAGGIIGSVVAVSQDGKEITLKVDDNTRIKFHRNYITTVLVEEKKDETEKKA